MRRLIAVLLSGAMAAALAGDADAKSKHTTHRCDLACYAAKYPGATPRQLRNAMAYDRGEYYEMDSNAHPVGSRSWWELKEREGGGRGGFRF